MCVCHTDSEHNTSFPAWSSFPTHLASNPNSSRKVINTKSGVARVTWCCQDNGSQQTNTKGAALKVSVRAGTRRLTWVGMNDLQRAGNEWRNCQKGQELPNLIDLMKGWLMVCLGVYYSKLIGQGGPSQLINNSSKIIFWEILQFDWSIWTSLNLAGCMHDWFSWQTRGCWCRSNLGLPLYQKRCHWKWSKNVQPFPLLFSPKWEI